MLQAQGPIREKVESRRLRNARGFSLVELLIVVMITIILTAIAIPRVQSLMYAYRLNSAVAMAKWAIQSTRFQALQSGYHFQTVFTAASANYQIQDLPSGTTYVNVGIAVPLSSWPITFSGNTTINFSPNGSVSEPVGTNVFTITYQGITKTLTVSNYGNVTIS
jgi:type II secretory pathway pseudopilin PulG